MMSVVLIVIGVHLRFSSSLWFIYCNHLGFFFCLTDDICLYGLSLGCCFVWITYSFFLDSRRVNFSLCFYVPVGGVYNSKFCICSFFRRLMSAMCPQSLVVYIMDDEIHVLRIFTLLVLRWLFLASYE